MKMTKHQFRFAVWSGVRIFQMLIDRCKNIVKGLKRIIDIAGKRSVDAWCIVSARFSRNHLYQLWFYCDTSV